MDNSDETKDSPQIPTVQPKRRSARLSGQAIVSVGVFVLGLSWIGLETWKAYSEGLLWEPGPSYLTAVHYWDGGDVAIQWKWKRTGLSKDNNGENLTFCVAEGVIRNRGATDLSVSSLSLFLEHRGLRLFEWSFPKYGSSFPWRDNDGKLQIGEPIPSGEEGTFTLEMEVPTGLLQDVTSLSASLAFSREENGQ